MKKSIVMAAGALLSMICPLMGYAHVVGIDAGHQGSWVDMSEQEPNGPGSGTYKAKATTGTQGYYTNVPEFQLNLDISLALRDLLEQRGYEVVMVREDNDTAISNAERALKAAEEGSEVYIRIHANGSDDHSVSGALGMTPSPDNAYIPELYSDSYKLTDDILSTYCAETGFANLGIQYHDDMTGINWSKVPVTILEMGFMTNEYDDTMMQDPDMQKKMVLGIADGIDRYFGIDRSSTPMGDDLFEDSSETDLSETEGNAAETDVSGQEEDAAVVDASEKEEDIAKTDETEIKSTGIEALNQLADVKSEDPDQKETEQEMSETASSETKIKPEDMTPYIRELTETYLADREALGEKWSVSMENLSDHTLEEYYADEVMQSASVVKVFIMGTVYDRMCYPSSPDRLINANEAYDGELRSLLEQMITVSDNEAANELIRRLGGGDFEKGAAVINEFCQENGYTATSIGRPFLGTAENGDNYTSAADCRKILSDIYQGNCVGKEASEKMLSILKQQTRTWKLPSGLPEGYTSANKTGEMPEGYGLGCIENDMMIAFSENGDFVLAVMSNELGGRNDEAQSLMGEISAFTAEYLQK